MKIQFKSKEHKMFYENMMKQCSKNDSYHRSLFYTLGISQDCRKHIQDLYDVHNDKIVLDGLHQDWQTSGFMPTPLLAFNLWNGFTLENTVESTPYDLFQSEDCTFYFEAVKVRYPEYCREHQNQLREER